MLKKILFNKYLIKNFTYQSAKVPAKAILNLISVIILTRYLSPEEYGYVITVTYLFSLLSFFGINGLNSMIIRNVSKGNSAFVKKAFSSMYPWVLLYFPVSLALVLLYYENGSEVVALTFLFSIFFKFLGLFFNKYSSILVGQKKFLTESFFSISMCLGGYLALLVLYVTDSVFYYIISFHFIDTFLLLLFFRHTFKSVKIANLEDKKFDADIKAGFNLTKVGILNNLTRYFGGLILGPLGGFQAVASYGLAKRIYDLIADMIRALSIIPSVKFAENNKSLYSNLLTKYLQLILYNFCISHSS